MKIFVRTLTLLLTLLAFLQDIDAQRGGWNQDPAEAAKQQTARMTEDLSLSEKQAEKAGEINLKYAQKMKETREANRDGDWNAMRETMMKMREEQNEELKKILTTDQFEKWTRLQEERWKERRQGGPRGKKGEDHNPPQGNQR